MRGRKPAAPGLQEARGNPGRRKSAAQKRLDEMDRVAGLLAQSPAGDDPLSTPALIDGSNAAIAVWRDLAPRLRTTHRLQPLHRPMFALFCVYFAEWVVANEDVNRNGYTQKVKTVAGGMMERTRPIVAIRDGAFDKVVKLSGLFGLTPSDEYSLFRDQAVAASQNPSLFDLPTAPRAEQSAEAPEATPSLVGVLGRMDTKPPLRPN